MIFDKEVFFSDPQTVTTGTDTGLTSEHVYDLGVAGREVAVGEPLYIRVQVTTAFTSSGSNEPLAVYLLTDDNASMSSATVVDKLCTLPAVAAVGDYMVGVIAPKAIASLERYIALQYKTEGDGTALTAGAVKAFLTVDRGDRYVTYADNITIT